MTTLYLAWQDYKSRRWFPVGRLETDEDAAITAYSFSYLSGAEDAPRDGPILSDFGVSRIQRALSVRSTVPSVSESVDEFSAARPA